MTDKNRFYKIYSPKKFKLRPREDIYLDLKFNIQTPERIEPWLNLLPSLKEMGLHIENDDWASNIKIQYNKKTIQKTIQLNYTYLTEVSIIRYVLRKTSVSDLFFN